MRWALSWRADPLGREMADRHYSRQTPRAPQFVPPGRCLVLVTPDLGAVWVTSWPYYVRHAWDGAWVCSIFRNEARVHLSSELIVEAVAATRWTFGTAPDHGMVTFVDPEKTRRKRDPGRCFRRAGFVEVGVTRKAEFVALQLAPAALVYIPPAPPLGAQLSLLEAA